MTDQIDQDADTRTERALTAYLRQELSAPATAIMGYAEMLMNDAVRSGRAALIDDLRRILDASRSLYGLILSLLDRAAIPRTNGISESNFVGCSATPCARRSTQSKDTEKCCARTWQMLARKLCGRSRQAPRRGKSTPR